MNRPYLRRRSLLPVFLCGTPEMRWKKTFFPPDFAPPGRGHPSDPRPHVRFYAYYFRGMKLGLITQNPSPFTNSFPHRLPALGDEETFVLVVQEGEEKLRGHGQGQEVGLDKGPGRDVE